MRRVVALLLVALVTTLVPIGPAGIAAAEPEASPSVAPTPTPTEAPTVGIQADEPAAPAALTEPFVYFNNLYESVVVNTPLQVTVVMYPNPDGGTLSYQIDGVTIESAPADAAIKQFQWIPTETGPVTFTASYSGSATIAPGISAPSVVAVIPPYPTEVDVSATPATFMRNTPTPLIATVIPDPGPGTVTFKIDNVAVATADLVGGTATASVTVAQNGLHSLVAVFDGNADWSTRASSIYQLIVTGDTMSLDLTPPVGAVAGPVTVTATLSSDPGGGTIDWSLDGVGVSYGNSVPVGPGGVTSLDLGTMTPGYHHLFARFTGYGSWGATSKDIWFMVYLPSSTALTTNRTTATVGELPVVLTATVDTDPGSGTTVTLVDDVGGVVVNLATLAVDPYTKTVTFSSSALRVGTHAITARFSGSNGILSSVSAPVTVTVAADKAVHATFKASMTAFYPYKDLFKDTVSLGGVLDEKATVTVRIYNSAGTLKRILSLGTRSGSYATTWNGRTSSGAALPAGKYTVKASFKDLRANIRTITSTVSMSWKQAIWKSAAVVRYGDQFSYYADVPEGRLFYSPDYTRGRTLMTQYIDRDCEPDCAWISGLASFNLATAGLGYRSLYIHMEGHGYVDYNTCNAWLIRPTTGAWEVPSSLPLYLGTYDYQIVVATAYIDTTKRINVGVSCTEQMGEAWDLHYLKLTYQYAVWK